ncbi:MAG: hypothetical protein STHCBS139747_007050 [Sporothrix thermara]
MGKSRRNRSGNASRRPDPMSGGVGSAGRPAKPVKEPADPALAALRTAKILPVLNDLRSADPAKRSTAAAAIANIVDDARCRKLLLREQVVHLVLSETLADASVESRAAGWAVLNVLAQHEAADFCVHLYRSDVLTPAAHALAQIRASLEGGSTSLDTKDAKLTKAQQEFLWRITSAILDLVGQLADARDEILAAIAKDAAIVRALFALAAGSESAHISAAARKNNTGGASVGAAASPAAIPFEIQWAALTTLARLCDDEGQRALCETLVDDQASGGCYGALRRLQAAGGPLAVAASSVLHAVFASLEWYDHSPGRDGASDAVLVPTLAGVIAAQLDKESSATTADVAMSTQDGADSAGDDDGSQSAEVLGLALETLAVIGTTLKASLDKGNKDEAVWNGIQDGEAGEGTAAGDESIVFGTENGDNDDEDMEMADGDDDAAPASRKKKNANPDDSMDVDGDDDGNDDDDDDDDDDDEDDEIDIEDDMERVTALDDAAGETGADLEDLTTLRALITDAIPQIIRLVAARAQDAAADSVAVLLDALSALNNIAWTVSLVDLHDDGNAAIRHAWRPVARRIWLRVVRPLLSDDSSLDLHVAAQVAGLAWALARVLGGTTPVDAGEPARFKALREMATATAAAEAATAGGEAGDDKNAEEDDPFQSLPVKCIGVLGQMALDPAPADQNRQISTYLLGVVAALPDRKSSPAEVVEALNQLFDIYGDEKADCDKAVFWADNLLAAFEAALPKAKAMAKTIDKRAHTELRTRADEAVLNLGRFIQYKKKHVPHE